MVSARAVAQPVQLQTPCADAATSFLVNLQQLTNSSVVVVVPLRRLSSGAHVLPLPHVATSAPLLLCARISGTLHACMCPRGFPGKLGHTIGHLDGRGLLHAVESGNA